MPIAPEYFHKHIPVLFFLLLVTLLAPQPLNAEGESREKTYGQFALILPGEWDGDEQTGFISDNPEEYMLTLTRRDEKEDKISGQVSVYLLPNKPGKNSRESAEVLAESQGEASEPAREGIFWTFTGEPRSAVIKGKAKTMVNADKDNLLIIIAHNPEDTDVGAITSSLRGVTPRARQMLGK